VDAGFILLDDEAADQLGEDRFLSPADCDLSATGRRAALYGALGYPACLNEEIGPDCQSPTTPNPFLYTAHLHSAAEYAKIDVSPRTHLLLDVSQRKTLSRGGPAAGLLRQRALAKRARRSFARCSSRCARSSRSH